MAVLDVQNLTLSFGERTLFAGVSFSIKEREKVGFVGANGVGKTSLFKVICGDYTPDSGGAFLSKNCSWAIWSSTPALPAIPCGTSWSACLRR